MACDKSYTALSKAPAYALNALMNELTKDAGLGERCPIATLAPPPMEDCEDAPSFGTTGGFIPNTCSSFVGFWSAIIHQSAGWICDNWLAQSTLKDLHDQLKGAFSPPSGVDQTTLAVDLCRGYCMQQGGGPCWSRMQQHAWC